MRDQPRRRRFLSGPFPVWVLLGLVLLQAQPSPERYAPGRFPPEQYLGHVKYLASAELKGRGTGTAGLEKAADYIEKIFRRLGVGGFANRAYTQPFPITINARLGRNNRLEVSGLPEPARLRPQRDFIPLPFSATGAFSGRVVFAGYGISAREYRYDDYEGVDVRGKWVLILRHEPQEFDENSVFSGRVYTGHAQYFSKALNARAHGALGVLMVSDTASHGGSSDELEPFSRLAGPGSAGLPFIHVKADVAAKWLELGGKKLSDIEAAIDADLRPRSFALPDQFVVRATVDLNKETRRVRNVGLYLPGRSAEFVVVGAHYDHIGLGEQFSMAPAMAGTPHPGADDNASGTAGLLELARYFARRPVMRRGIMFVAFAGEEIGLLGSSYFVHHPPAKLSEAVAMINLDMIGRIRDNQVLVGGVSTSPAFAPLLEELAGAGAKGEGAWLLEPRLRFEVSDKSGYGSSDHTSFTAASIPVLFFFSGLHADYHRPSDTWDRIDAPQACRLLDFVAALVERIAFDEQRPAFALTPVAGGPAPAGEALE